MHMDKLPLYRNSDHTNTDPIKLIVFEDNHNFRDSLLHLFSYYPDITLLGAFEDAQNIQQTIQDLNPDVILMDIDMPGINGIEATALSKEIAPAVHVIMLTVSEDEDRIFQALRNGAVGYILKKAGLDEILEGVRLVKTGGSPMTPAIARKVMNFFYGQISNTPLPIQPQPTDKPEEHHLFSELTPREQEILEGLVDGLSYKMIAARYYISADTVKNHIQGIYRKLHVNSKGEAISIALKKRIVDSKSE
jgi:DNA-binding NarL/FixJ family response regulator